MEKQNDNESLVFGTIYNTVDTFHIYIMIFITFNIIKKSENYGIS